LNKWGESIEDTQLTFMFKHQENCNDKIVEVKINICFIDGCILDRLCFSRSDKVATHDDDQSVESGDNEGYINN